MPGKILTPLKLSQEARRAELASLVMGGQTDQTQLAKILGVSRVTINKDLKAVRQLWRMDMVEMFDHAKEEQLKRIDKVEREAWAAWVRSQRVRKRLVKKRDENGKLYRAVDCRPLKVGSSTFLDIVRRCVEDRRKLLGLDEPEQIDFRAQFVFRADQLSGVIQDNADFVEYQRQLAFSGTPGLDSVPGSNGQERLGGEVDAGQTLDVTGYDPLVSGNGSTTPTAAVQSGQGDRPKRRRLKKAH